MLQVPSTPQNQLLDQYDDMIQFYHRKKKMGRGQGVALCHVFPWFTIILLKQLYTLVNTSEGWKPHL